jgi:hypothetical protein
MMQNDELLDVLLQLPGAAPRKWPANPSATIGDFLRDAGVGADLLVFGVDVDVDDGDEDLNAEPIMFEIALRDLANGRLVAIHCHHCRQIQVTVHYGKESILRKFPPSARARKVLRWAKRKLRLTDADADNLALFLCRGGEQVRETTHLGELVEEVSCDICFNLSKDRNIEGSP